MALPSDGPASSRPDRGAGAQAANGAARGRPYGSESRRCAGRGSGHDCVHAGAGARGARARPGPSGQARRRPAKPAPAAKPAAGRPRRPRPRPPPPAPRTAAGRAAYTTPSGGKIVVYQPQVASWDDQKHMVAYAAVSYEAKGAPKPALGSVKIEADTKVAVVGAARQLHGPARSPSPTSRRSPKEQMREVVAEIDKAIPDDERVIGARPRAGQRRPQPDHPEERRGREGGPARRSSSARRPRCS